MTREEFVRKAIKAYFEGLTPDELKSVSSKRMKYTKKYFDSMGEEFGIEPPYKKEAVELKGKKNATR